MYTVNLLVGTEVMLTFARESRLALHTSAIQIRKVKKICWP